MPTAALIDISSRHQVYLEGLKTGEVNSVLEFLKEIDKSVRTRLAGRTLTDFSRGRLEKLLASVEKDISLTMKGVVSNIKGSVNDLATYEAGFEKRSLNQVVDVEFVVPTSAQLKAAVFSNPLSIPNPMGNNILDPFIKQLDKKSRTRVSSAIRAGYFQGETTPRILQRVRGTRAAGFKDGVIGHIGRDINTITRTALQHASSQARQTVWEQNKRVIKRVRWVSTLDNRTSNICRGLDGREFAVDRGPRPPIHANCRSSTTAVLADRFRSLSEGRTRSSRSPDGTVKSVSANQNYYDWLKNQPQSFQNSVIGPTRGKLLRDGGLSSQRFQELQLGKNFAPLTLEQMKRLEPVAFGKAKI